MQSNAVVKQKTSRKTLIIVLLIFIVPAVLSTLLYTSGWKPSATVNHGELIVPAKPIADRELVTLEGKPMKFSELLGKWTMVYFDTAACPDECNKQLYFMRQIHRSQGKNMDRIQRVFILNDGNSVDKLKAKLTEYPEMIVLKADKEILSKLSQEFGINPDSTSEQRNIYLLDYLGNLMMRYQPDTEPAGMRKDLERLLKYASDKQ